MTLPRKLTEGELKAVRAELVQLVDRINGKILKITWTHQKLPYERLAKGRRLKELCLLCIQYLDEGRMVDLGLCIRELEHRGVEIRSWKIAQK